MALGMAQRREVAERAAHRCEYCGLAQARQEAAFHIDHIQPVSDGGGDELQNLALACVSCSLRKGARRVAPDPETGAAVALFHPRREAWAAHFRRHETRVVGLTPAGRATVAALQMNRPLALAIREEEALRGRQPPREW